ncbi:MAG: transglycosylase domain-containing protein [Clostridia bacterium]
MKKFVKFLIILILILTSLGLLIIGNGYNMYKEAIQEMPIQEKVEEIRQKENYTKLSELPQIYINAVISVEDHRFYEHNGIDVIAIGRAIINDIKAMSFVEGGSTITQQIAKNEYFTQEKKITRKVAEVFVAFELEKQYTKNEILELYINTIYFGNGYYNIKDAAKGYFGKSITNLSDSECIMLAGIPNAPSVYAPTQNPELAKQRQKQVAEKMVKYGYLTENEKNKVLSK